MSTKIKPKFSFKLLSILLAVLMVVSSFPVAAGSAFAEDETNQISMTFVVTDTAEQPVKGATVEIRDNDTRNVLTTSTLIGRLKNTYETDENGKVTFDVDEVDVYDYTVTAKGMSTVSGKINKTDLADPKKNDGIISVSLNYLVECSMCKGTGEQNCPKCNGTGKICSTCSGIGKIDQECPECNGVDSENCAKCLGKGTVEEECPDCNDESKQIDCPDCNGNKTVECKTCYGTKEIEARDFEFKFDGDVSVPYKGSVENPVSVQDETNANKATYSSDNADITVDENGTITAGKKAKVGDWATITAIIPVDKENGYKAKRATCKVTVCKSKDIESLYSIKYSISYIAAPVEFITAKAQDDKDAQDSKDDQKISVVYYKKDDESKTPVKPEDVGTYRAEVSADGYENKIIEEDFVITPAELTIIPDEGQSKEYGEVPNIKFDYKVYDEEKPEDKVETIDFNKITDSKKPVFVSKDNTYGLSYDGFKGETAENDEEPDRIGNDNVITLGNLILDESAKANKNYEIGGIEKVYITVNDIIPEEDKELITLPTGYYEYKNGEKTEYWYNKEYFDNHNNVVEFKVPNSEKVTYKINTERNFSGKRDSVSFTKECDFIDHTIYVKKIYKNETNIFKKYSYTKVTVNFGIDRTVPKLNIKEGPNAQKPIKFVTQDESENPIKILGRLLGFGNFFNTKIEATVDAIDDGEFASGIDETSYEMWLGTQEVKNAEVEGESNKTVNNVIRNFSSNNNVLTIEENKSTLKGNVFVSVKDKAGNELKDELVTDKNSEGLKNTGFMIENNKPYLEGSTEKDKNAEIKVEADKDKGVRQSGDVYSGDVTFKFTAKDDESGLYNVDIKAYTNKKPEGTNISYAKVIDEEHKLGIDGEQTYSESFSISTAYITEILGKAATYTIEITVADNAGNVSDIYTKIIYIDRQAPVVTKFEITGTGTSDGDTASHKVEETSYGFYFKETAEVKVSFQDFGTDENWASGVTKVKIYLYDKDANKYYQVEKTNGVMTLTTVNSVSDVKAMDLPTVSSDNKTVTVTFTVAQDFKGQIYAMAYDAVENSPGNTTDMPDGYNDPSYFSNGYQKPDGDIIESLTKHNASYAINFNAPETKNTDKDGTPLYSDLDNKGINLDLTVSDTYSGIKSISVEVSAPYDTDENFKHKVTVGKNARDSGALTYDNSGTRENDWVITKYDENLATEMKNTINITNNSNDIEVKVTLVDRASHESTKSYKLSIDKTKPEIEITYKNNDVQNGKYYQDDRTATVTVRELNLSTPAQFNITALCDETDIKPSEQALEELIKKTYDKKNFEKFHKEVGEEGKKTEYYEFIFEIPAKTQGDYEITASVTDNSGNKSDYNRVDKFSVDTTTPFITVTFDNNQSRNGNYFATKRTATITVTDRYFDATQSPVVINSTDNGNKISAPSQSGWSKQNSKYEQSCTVDFSKDGKYSFIVDTTDLSGKQATQYTVSDFIIDNTDPTIKLYINNEEVKDGENRAYIDEVMPKVVVEDTNFSQTDTKVTITPVVAKDKTNFGYESSIISKNAKNENGMTYVFNNFTGEDGKERKYDNIYNLDVSTTDKSGHTTKAQRITFSVNRYGSVYICEPNKYYAEKPVIQVEEVNVNPINFKSKETYINVISSSGKTQTLKSKDLIIQKQEASDKNWYSYLYAIPSSCFDIDDVYSIKVSSKDKAKRVSTNINDANKKDITFTVDTTNPYFEVTNYIENENIKADSKELEIALMDDTSGIASYSISFDGQPIENVDTKIYENKINFKFNVKGATSLKDAKGRQLEVRLTDAAGRTNTMSDKDKSTYNVRISSNVFVEALATLQDFYRNTVAFWCTVAGIIAAIGIVIWIILAKNKKKSNENE